MKALIKLLLGVAVAAALIAYLTSRRGSGTRDRLTGYVKEAADLVGTPSFGRATSSINLSQPPVDDEAIRSKIDETRRRLQDQLDAQLKGRTGTSAA